MTVEVDRILNDNISIIYSLDPDAEVGYRGSLVTGIKYKSKTPFDVNDFDVDAFIVSDKLASEYFSSGTTWMNARRIPGITPVSNKIEQNFINSFDGYRYEAKKPFTFRVYTSYEFNFKISSTGVKILGGGN